MMKKHSVLPRLARLLIGQPLYGTGCGVVLAAGLGVEPWTVLAEGLSGLTGIGIGWMTNLLGAVILLLWIPLRERPGVGTVLNVLLVGTFLGLTADTIPPVDHLGLRLAMVAGGIALVGVGSGIYLGADWGAGPRDGLMRGIARRSKRPLWQARLALELSVLAIGWLLGGTVGIGTVLFAVLIGPAVQQGVRVFAPRTKRVDAPPATSTT